MIGNNNNSVLENKKVLMHYYNSDSLSQLKERNVGSRLSYTPPSTNNTVNGLNTKADIPPSSRRSRADTMPSTIPPFINLGSANLYNSISNVAQQRPNHNNKTGSNSNEAMSMYHSSGMSSPLDENATNSIASTLASLGLNEDESLSTDNNNNSQAQYYEPVTRSRSYTVSSRMMDNQQNNNRDMMSFSPFAPSSKPSSRRPRAISLGITDSPLPPPTTNQQQQQSFSPFDSLYLQQQQSDYQRNTNINLTDSSNNSSNSNGLPMLYQSRNLFTHMDSHEEEDDDNNKMIVKTE